MLLTKVPVSNSLVTCVPVPPTSSNSFSFLSLPTTYKAWLSGVVTTQLYEQPCHPPHNLLSIFAQFAKPQGGCQTAILTAAAAAAAAAAEHSLLSVFVLYTQPHGGCKTAMLAAAAAAAAAAAEEAEAAQDGRVTECSRRFRKKTDDSIPAVDQVLAEATKTCLARLQPAEQSPLTARTLGSGESSQTGDKAHYADLACLMQMTFQHVTKPASSHIPADILTGTAETTFALLNSMSNRMHCRLNCCTAALVNPEMSSLHWTSKLRNVWGP